MKVLVIHHVNGATRTATLHAPHVSTQETATGGFHVALSDEIGAPVTGVAMFTAAGLVALSGAAVDQYGFAKEEATDA